MLRKTPLRSMSSKRRKRLEGPTAPREPRPLARLERAVTYVGATRPAPKPETLRNRTLLDMQRGRPCKLLAVSNCETTRGETTVAAHENEGKGMGIKASDLRSVGACYPCHVWYDQSGAPKAEKRRAFAAAYERQVEEWERIAQDASEPERFRKVASWALEKRITNRRQA